MANGHGGPRPGSGRPKGTHIGAQLKSRLSPAQQARAAEAVRLANGDCQTFSGDAYALLVFIYQSTDLPLSFRMRAAETAIAYERPKLAQVQFKRDEDDTPTRLLRDIMALVSGTGRGLPSEDPALQAADIVQPISDPALEVDTVQDTVHDHPAFASGR